VRLQGVCLTAVNDTGHKLADTLIIPDWNHLQVIPDSHAAQAESNSLPILTTAEQVQRLSREAAERGYPVELKGVVTWVSENRDCVVLQDATRGVFVGLRVAWTLDVPNPGDILEIAGHCVPAEFSPIVILSRGTKSGRGLLPPPMHPTWEQLIGGSLDDQYIEISGLATDSRDTNHLTLLMPGGKTEIEFEPPPAAPLASFIHSVVRIRGVMFANWEAGTHMVTPNRPLRFGSAIICADVPPPVDPFSADRMHARELMQFDVRRNTFQRVKVLGQCLCTRGGTCFMTDQGFGFRVEPVQPVQFAPGDMLDVVGLVELGGASPVLREAITRKISHLALPPPEPLDFDQTNSLHDSSRVWVAGLLLSIREAGSDHVLEMQSDLNHFAARLPANAAVPWRVGSRLKLTGTLSRLGADAPNGQHLDSIELLLNSGADVELLARPSWWTLGRLLTMVALLTLGLALAFIWITLLRAQVERRSIQLQREINERQKAEQERAIEHERSRIALDLHDDLGSRLTAISMLATTGQGPAPSAESSRDRLQLIADKARLLVTTLDGLVWAVDPKNDTVASLAEYLASFAEEFLARTGIACHVELPHDYPDRTVASEARHNILLAVREALNNAVRHGHPREVRLQLACSERELSILLRDDGRGFDLQKVTPGNGLANLQERLRKINGLCRIGSSPGKGTAVVLTLPI
jgi:signal transduction histidine kinase